MRTVVLMIRKPAIQQFFCKRKRVSITSRVGDVNVVRKLQAVVCMLINLQSRQSSFRSILHQRRGNRK
jgi:hypothetical protein